VTDYRQYDPAVDEFGRDGYPKAWHREIKHAVRAEAGHRCVRCGHPYRNGEHGDGHWSPCDARCTHPSTREEDLLHDATGVRLAAWRILTVHHLDGDKANCRWWNLASLCQRCHLHIQGKVDMARVYPFEHTAWMQPYVAGYYAHVYLNEDLAPAEVFARLPELLQLERIA
jgi:hypothetical protein